MLYLRVQLRLKLRQTTLNRPRVPSLRPIRGPPPTTRPGAHNKSPCKGWRLAMLPRQARQQLKARRPPPNCYKVCPAHRGAVSAAAGETFSVTVQYTTSDNDDALTGLGLRIHYNSSLLTFNGLSNVLQTSFLQQSSPMADTADYDQDPTTDKYVLVSWADIYGNWPDQALPVTLFTASFTLAPGVAAGTQTAIRFSAASTAADYDFQSQPITVTSTQVTPSGDISGYVYSDANRNGVMDTGEELPGVTIALYQQNAAGNWVAVSGETSQVTDDTGWYQFSSLPATVYQVVEGQPAAFLPGGPDAVVVNLTSGGNQTVDFWNGDIRPQYLTNQSDAGVAEARWFNCVGGSCSPSHRLRRGAYRFCWDHTRRRGA